MGMVTKVRCTSGKHEDATPSCAVYEDGTGWCFTCNTFFNSLAEPVKSTPKEVENIEEKIQYVESLPKQTIRGLTLPFDNAGYYVVWPDKSYYKRRNWTSDSYNSRYSNPRGVTQPLLVCTSPSPTKTLIIVEGEINALSIAHADPTHTVISPGSAGQFKSAALKEYLYKLYNIDTLVMLVDNDVPGLEACLLLSQLLSSFPGIIIRRLMDKDANEVLQEYGTEALKETITRLAMPRGLP